MADDDWSLGRLLGEKWPWQGQEKEPEASTHYAAWIPWEWTDWSTGSVWFYDCLALLFIVVYLNTELRSWHKTEYEKIFWLCIGLYAGARVGSILELRVPFMIMASLIGVQVFDVLESYVRDFVSLRVFSDTMRRLRGDQAQQYLRIQAESGTMHQGSLRGKSFRLKELVERVSKAKSAGSTVLVGAILNQNKRSQEEIHDIIQNASANELNYFLSYVNCGKLAFAASKDTFRILLGDSSGWQMAGIRMKDLSLEVKAFLLDGLQRVGIHTSNSKQTWTRNILLSVRGADMTILKAIMDSRGDWHSMHKLVFYDLRGAWKSEVLRHLHSEGMKIREMYKQKITKVVADLDDTVQCSGGLWPAGIDRRIPRKAMYPGVGTFIQEVHTHCSNYSSTIPEKYRAFFESSSLIFLTARPKSYKGMSQMYSYKSFVGPMKRKGLLYSEPVILSGDLKSALTVVLQALYARIRTWIKKDQTMPRGTAIWSPVAQKKAQALQEYMQIYPECNFVALGDNGQGDVFCSELLMERAGFKADSSPLRTFAIRASLIHNVRDVSETLSRFLRTPRGEKEDVEIPKEWDIMNIVMFKTYVGAGVEAFSCGLITLDCVVRVALAVVEEVFLLQSYFPEWRDRHNYIEEVLIDLRIVHELCERYKERKFCVLLEKQIEECNYIQTVNDNLRNLDSIEVKRTVAHVHRTHKTQYVQSPRTKARTRMLSLAKKWRRNVLRKNSEEKDIKDA